MYVCKLMFCYVIIICVDIVCIFFVKMELIIYVKVGKKCVV